MTSGDVSREKFFDDGKKNANEETGKKTHEENEMQRKKNQQKLEETRVG